MAINGATRLYAIVGDPIAQVRSPEVFTERFAALGANAILVPMHVRDAQFEAVFPALLDIGNLDGLLVTVPFKARALRYATRVGKTASCIGALNALRREVDGTWTGDMFDGTGFVRGLEAKGGRAQGRRVLLFGAGGAGSAIACALAEAGVQRIDFVDPLADRAQALADRLRAAFPACGFSVAKGRASDIDMVVNASTVGMRSGDGLPGDVGTLARGTIVGDVIISDAPTPLMRLAADSGCTWVNGRDMHTGQSGAIVEFFAPGGRR
jgi:shikimate dehydrogenase